MIDHLNRVLWSLIALALLAGGLGGLVARSTETPGVVLGQLREPGGLVLVAAAAGGLAAAVLGALLLRAELRPAGPPRLADLRLRRERGTTIVRSRPVGRGLERELARIPGVQRAAAGLLAPTREPRARLRLHLDAAADVEPVRRHVDRALQRFAITFGRPAASVEVLVRLQTGRRRR